MPSESQSQSHARPSLVNHRSTSSNNSQTDSPSNTPPHGTKQRVQKHVVGGGRVHARVPSSKGLHKLAKAHGNDGSHDNLKKLVRNTSATHLKKNNSHVSLKRNQSSTDIARRPKSSQGQSKRPASVHFEIGDQEDAWEEASSSASPALSRSASRPNSAKQSASNSQPHSPEASSFKSQPAAVVNGSNQKAPPRHTADAKVITERLLQRTPSHNTTKMSLATATPATGTGTSRAHSPDSTGKSQSSTTTSTPKIGSNTEMVSRFVSGSGTPSDSPYFLHNRKSDGNKNQDDIKRAQSMGNLTRREAKEDGEEEEEEEERALAPRSRKSSTSNATGNGAYNPPQQSRTQQKLWLQRASSNIEPQQMAPSVAAMNGLSALHGGLGSTALVGAGYDGRDPRIRQQLERTGLEYLVVRRHQDPVGKALKRLALLPGKENRRIPTPSVHGSAGTAHTNTNASRHAATSSISSTKDRAGRRKENNTPAAATTGSASTTPATTNGVGVGRRSSFEGPGSHGTTTTGGIAGSGSVNGNTRDGDGRESVSARLRSLWDKNFDFSSSAD